MNYKIKMPATFASALLTAGISALTIATSTKEEPLVSSTNRYRYVDDDYWYDDYHHSHDSPGYYYHSSDDYGYYDYYSSDDYHGHHSSDDDHEHYYYDHHRTRSHDSYHSSHTYSYDSHSDTDSIHYGPYSFSKETVNTLYSTYSGDSVIYYHDSQYLDKFDRAVIELIQS